MVDPTAASVSRIERSLRYVLLCRDFCAAPGSKTASSSQLQLFSEADAVLRMLQASPERSRTSGETSLSHSPSPPESQFGKKLHSERPNFPPSAAPAAVRGRPTPTNLFASAPELLKDASGAMPSKAVMLLETAVTTHPDYVLAKAELAFCLLYGHGTQVQIDKALQLLDECIQVGHPGAMLAVGKCLRDGVGVHNDLSAALHWVFTAANMGYLPAMHELGEMFEEGITSADSGDESTTGNRQPTTIELEKDLVQSYRWYRAAASRGYVDSQLNLGKLYMMSASTLESDEAAAACRDKAVFWLQQASRNGSLEATGLLRR